MPGSRTRCSATSARAPRSCMLKNSMRTVSSPPRPEPRRYWVSSASSRCTEHRRSTARRWRGTCRAAVAIATLVASLVQSATRLDARSRRTARRTAGSVGSPAKAGMPCARRAAMPEPCASWSTPMTGRPSCGQRQRQPGARGAQAAHDGVPAEAAEPVALELLTEHHRRGLEQRAHRHERCREAGHLEAPVQVAVAAAVREHGELEGEVQVVEERAVDARRGLAGLRHEPGEAQDDEHDPRRPQGGTTGAARPTRSPRAEYGPAGA